MNDIDQYAEWVESRWHGNDPLNLRDHFVMSNGLPEEATEALEMFLKLLVAVGKVNGTLKKQVRDNNPALLKLKKELGDIFYYLVRICTAHGMKPSEVLLANIEKIDDRNIRGVIHGSGDDR